MDYRRWTEVQQNPTNPISSADSYSRLYNVESSNAHYPYYSRQYENPNQTLAPSQSGLNRYERPSHFDVVPDTGLRPQGIYSHPTSNSYTHHQHVGVGFETPAAASYGHQKSQIGALPLATSYQDPHTTTRNWALKEAIRCYGTDPAAYAAAGERPLNETKRPFAATSNSVPTTESKIHHPINDAFWKGRKKKTKVVQSAWCDICKVECSNKEILEKHKFGRRHKKNVKKLEASEESGDPESITTDQSRKKRDPSSETENKDDVEAKKRKLIDMGGAAEEGLRVCTICNVVCGSETVYMYHLAGKRHALVVQKQAKTEVYEKWILPGLKAGKKN